MLEGSRFSASQIPAPPQTHTVIRYSGGYFGCLCGANGLNRIIIRQNEIVLGFSPSSGARLEFVIKFNGLFFHYFGPLEEEQCRRGKQTLRRSSLRGVCGRKGPRGDGLF